MFLNINQNHLNDALNFTIEKDSNELEAAKMIGAGLVAIALAAEVYRNFFGNYLLSHEKSVVVKKILNLLLGFALAEVIFIWTCSCNDYFICILEINMSLKYL